MHPRGPTVSSPYCEGSSDSLPVRSGPGRLALNRCREGRSADQHEPDHPSEAPGANVARPPTGGRPEARGCRPGAGVRRVQDDQTRERAVRHPHLGSARTPRRLQGHRPGERAHLESLALSGSQKGWWTRYANAVDSAYAAYIAVETEASEVYNVETSLIPGLLQTPGYTEAAIRLQGPNASDELIKTQVNVRAERRKVLARATPLQLWVILAESVLYHRVGGVDVMRNQLEALLSASREANIELQILPRNDPMNACLYGPFVIMSFPGAESDVVYTDSPTSTVYYEENKDVETYTTIFRRLNAASCSVEESRRLISTALTEMV